MKTLKKAIPRLLSAKTRKVFSRSAHENQAYASTSSPVASMSLPPTLPDFSFITLDEHLPMIDIDASKSWETFELALLERASRSSATMSLAAETLTSASAISSLATPAQSDASFIVATDASHGHDRDPSPLLLSPWIHPSSQFYHQSPDLDSNLSLGVFIPESLLVSSPKTPERAVSPRSYQDQMEIQALRKRVTELEQECAELREDNKIIYESFLALRQESKRLNKRLTNFSARTTAYGSDYGVPINIPINVTSARDSPVIPSLPVSAENIVNIDNLRVTMLDVPHGAAESLYTCPSPSPLAEYGQYGHGPGSHFRRTVTSAASFNNADEEDEEDFVWV
ncbi:hypothetical protein D9758_005770 [Tetrapyrgos nigripes]|uniref:Uncharacterized protein n=1 Tax=Tetrapyrgos nigripes TaxID=182062 RepID=A0A8H5LQT9_9AGAR|nr:hypothetical protein D9758_005770 [Tetrapyrgos nigripes]